MEECWVIESLNLVSLKLVLKSGLNLGEEGCGLRKWESAKWKSSYEGPVSDLHV